jgi:hypothetical protein
VAENTRNPADRNTAAALVLLAMMPLVDLGLLFDSPRLGAAGAPFLVAYFVFCWPRLARVAQIMLLVAFILSIIAMLRPGGTELIVDAAARFTFLPAFIAMLSLLRAAADQSQTTVEAGALLVRQPPGRRYLSLTLGGHVFGILLNLGGLALLIDLTRKSNTLAAGYGDPNIVEIRTRRMTLAVMRGFSCIALWSPLGVAINLLITLVPGLSWFDVAPYGFIVAVAFMGLGYLFDRLEYPAASRPPATGDDQSGLRAVGFLIGHILLLSSLTLVVDLVSGLSFQAVLVNVVPLYALGWLLMEHRRAPRPEGAARFVLNAFQGGINRWPTQANEIAIFAASGLMGVVLAALVPREALSAAIISLGASAGVLAMIVAGIVLLLGLLGINPLVSCSILAATLSTMSLPLSNANMVLALCGAWTIIIGFGPMLSMMVVVSGLVGRPPREIAFLWNGRFSLAATTLWLGALYFIRI